jgi:hypothetical protein
LKVNGRFGEACLFDLQGKISKARNQREAGCMQSLFFNPEDGGDMFFRNVGRLSADNTALYRRR